MVCAEISRHFSISTPPATEEEIRASALQFVRKLSGSRKPSKGNQAVFEEAVEEVTAAATKLLQNLVTTASPRNREEEAAKAKARNAKRFGGSAQLSSQS